MRIANCKKVKFWLLSCLVFLTAVFCMVFGVMIFNPISTHAEEVATNRTLLSGEYQTNGASMRIFKKTSSGNLETISKTEQGIRFHVEMGSGYKHGTTTLFDETNTNERGSWTIAEGYTTYTLVLPKRLMGDATELTLNTAKVMKLNTTDYWFTDDDGNIESVAYIYNIPDSYRTDTFVFKGIICDENGNVIAETETAERCLAFIAKMSYIDTLDTSSNYWGSSDLDQQAIPLLKEFIPTYTITYNNPDGSKIGEEEVLWGDAPVSVPSGDVNDTWYDEKNSEEAKTTETMLWAENRALTWVNTRSEEFLLTGVAEESNFTTKSGESYHGVKIYATLHKEAFANKTELDAHAVNVEHIRGGEHMCDGAELEGVWTLEEEGQMRLFFALDTTKFESGDQFLIKGDSVFYANGVMYRLTEDYIIDYTKTNGVEEYGMFLGYLNLGHVKAIYNANEDTNDDGIYDEFTIRIEFYEDIMITDSFEFKHANSDKPVYIQCGKDENVKHYISGGEYYWVQDESQPDGYTKILELIGTGVDTNYAYGRHDRDKLYGLKNTMLVQNGGYYIFEDEMFTEFVSQGDETTAGGAIITHGYWTIGSEVWASDGTTGLDRFGYYVESDTEVRFTTTNAWFETEGIAMLTISNMSKTESNAVYYTDVDGNIIPLNKLVYHGYSGYQLFGIRGVQNVRVGDTITIIEGTRLWYKQNYYTIKQDLVFCFDGREWFSGYDASLNAEIYNTDVGGINTDGSHNGEVRLWLYGKESDRQVLTSSTAGYMYIDERYPAIYNGVELTGINKAYTYGSANDMVSLLTGIKAAKEGDYFCVPAGSVWWTLFYADQDMNRKVTFMETIEATFNGSAWVEGNKQVTFNYIEDSTFTINGIEKGYLYKGNNYTFNISPADDYLISKVTINGIVQELNKNNEYSFTAQANNTVQVETVKGVHARFTVGDGAVVNNGEIVNGDDVIIAEGESLTFSVNVNEGYKLVSVTGATRNGDGTYTVNSAASIDVKTEKLYKVTYTGGTGYSISSEDVENGAWVENGTVVRLSVQANNGYTIMAVAGATRNNDGTYTATVNGADVNVTATVIESSRLLDVSNLITITRDDWMTEGGNATDCVTFSIRVQNPTGEGYLYEYLVVDPSIQGYWNDNGANFTSVNGVDIMEYLYFNGESARSIINKNASKETSYTGTTFPLSLGNAYAPIAIETTGSFTKMMVLKDWMPDDGFTITIKSGFKLLVNDGKVISTNKDVTFKFANNAISKVQAYTLSFENAGSKTVVNGQAIGALPEVPAKDGYTVKGWTIDGELITADTVYNYGADKTAVAAYTKGSETLDVSNLITITRDDWMTEGGSATDCVTFSIRVQNPTGEGYLYEYLVVDSLIRGYWNDNGASFTPVNGVDIMEYLYFNGESARSIINKNASGETSYKGTTFPLSAGGQYSPIAIETSGSFAKMMVLKDWMPDDGFTITIKSGFKLLVNDGNVISTNKDVTFRFENNAISKVQAYTLSFEDLDETMTVTGGQAIGELPADPKQKGIR